MFIKREIFFSYLLYELENIEMRFCTMIYYYRTALTLFTNFVLLIEVAYLFLVFHKYYTNISS